MVALRRLAPLAVPANLLALPVVAPVLWLGVAAVLAGSVWPPLAHPLLALADLLSAYLLWVARLCARGGTRRSPSGWAACENVSMKLSAKADYAVRAVLVLASHEGEHPMKGELIARAQDLPLKFVENILGSSSMPGSSPRSAGPTADTGWRSRRTGSRWPT